MTRPGGLLFWSEGRSLRAPALRFLLLCLCFWFSARAAMLWPIGQKDEPPPALFLASFRPSASTASGSPAPMIAAESVKWMPPPGLLQQSTFPLQPQAVVDPMWRHAPIAQRRRPASLPATKGTLPIAPSGDVLNSPFNPAPAMVAPRVVTPVLPSLPLAPQDGRGLAGWALSSWLFLRGGDGGDELLFAGGGLGGSQAGIRLAYGFGEDGRLRAYGRSTIALKRTAQREAAVGVAYAPVAALPIDIAVERRIALGPEGRDAFAVMATGGVDAKRLVGDLRLSAYAQAGVVGARSKDLFADGAAVIDHRAGRIGTAPVRVGAIVAGAAQPGAERLDIGPRASVLLPRLGRGARISFDWRHRVAGQARPDSGPALTLAADF